MTSSRPDPEADKRERVAIPLDPVAALRALLAVEPDAEPAEAENRDEFRAKPHEKQPEPPRK